MGVDLRERKGKDYLVIINYYSRYPSHFQGNSHSLLGASPAELAFIWSVCTQLPSLQKPFIPQTPQSLAICDQDEKAKQQQKKFYDRCHGVQQLLDFNPVDPVLIKTVDDKGWITPGCVKELCATHSYMVEIGQFRCNRRHLKLILTDLAHRWWWVDSPGSTTIHRSRWCSSRLSSQN